MRSETYALFCAQIRTMKRRILMYVMLFACPLFSRAQMDMAAVSLKNSLETILKDYPNAFRNLMGEEQGANPQFTEFACRVPLTGAISTHFSRFNTPNGNVVAFEALMLQSEDFKVAAAKYKSICSELKKGIFKMGQHRPYIMDGKFVPPSEEKAFHEVIYTLLPADMIVDKLKITVALDYVFPSWEVRIRVYDKDADNKEVYGDEDDDY